MASVIRCALIVSLLATGCTNIYLPENSGSSGTESQRPSAGSPAPTPQAPHLHEGGGNGGDGGKDGGGGGCHGTLVTPQNPLAPNHQHSFLQGERVADLTRSSTDSAAAVCEFKRLKICGRVESWQVILKDGKTETVSTPEKVGLEQRVVFQFSRPPGNSAPLNVNELFREKKLLLVYSMNHGGSPMYLFSNNFQIVDSTRIAFKDIFFNHEGRWQFQIISHDEQLVPDTRKFPLEIDNLRSQGADVAQGFQDVVDPNVSPVP